MHSNFLDFNLWKKKKFSFHSYDPLCIGLSHPDSRISHPEFCICDKTNCEKGYECFEHMISFFCVFFVRRVQIERPCRRLVVWRKCRSWSWTCCPGCVGPRPEQQVAEGRSVLAACWADWRSCAPSITTTSSSQDNSIHTDADTDHVFMCEGMKKTVVLSFWDPRDGPTNDCFGVVFFSSDMSFGHIASVVLDCCKQSYSICVENCYHKHFQDSLFCWAVLKQSVASTFVKVYLLNKN